MAGTARVKGRKVTIEQFTTEERTYPVSPNIRLLVQSGERVKAGAALAEGPLNPQDVLRVRGKDAIQKYLVEEVQRVYRSQGVVIHDKHIEIIARQMLRNVRISYPGDTQFLHGELVDRSLWKAVNEKSIAEEKTPATAETVLLGVTKVSLSTESFLAAASFQETTRVLTEAALFGKIDMLKGLKENVIIGRLIPAQLDSQKEQDRLMDEALIEPVLNIEEEGQEDTDSTVTDEEEDGLRALAALLNSSLDEEANTAGENETPASPSE
jgi:DNA-directed RNA polymerase subunit beta'